MRNLFILISILYLHPAVYGKNPFTPIEFLNMPTGSGVNPVNPNYSYPIWQTVNTQEAGIPYPGQMLSGYITVNQTSQSKIFYTLYAAGGNKNPQATVNDSAPLILWLQGGPGCADGGQYSEIGPFNVYWNAEGNQEPTANGITWNDEYHLLFVDAPVGVGYSVCGGDLPITAMQYAVHMQSFLEGFFNVFTSLKGQPFYIFGESYAGHYIPAVTTILLQNYPQNQIKVTGIGIGNGWTDPVSHMYGYSTFVYSAGLVDDKLRDQLAAMEQEFSNLVLAQNYTAATNVFGNVDGIISNLGTNQEWISIYDYRNLTGTPNNVYAWLNNATVKQIYGADPNIEWSGCVGSVYNDFSADISQSYSSNMTYILEQTIYNIEVLIYNGQDDVIVNTAGVQNYISHLKWNLLPAFLASPKSTWTDTTGYVIGNWQQYSRLTYVNVNKAGHGVPTYQPWSARNMLQNFIHNSWTSDLCTF